MTGEFGAFPFGEFTLVEVPRDLANQAGFNAVGAAGLLVLNSRAFDAPDTKYLLEWLGHEVGHQWFPHTVSLRTPPGLYMEEALAEYGGLRVVETIAGAAAAKQLRLTGYEYDPIYSALAYFKSVGAGLDQPLNDLEPRLEHRNLAYTKGALVFDMLSRELGRTAFRRILHEIVGIVGNTAYQPLDEDPIQPDFFTPYAQFTYATRMVIVRASRDPLSLASDLAAVVRRVEPGLPLFDVQTMEARARLSWSKRSFQAVLLTIVAGIALFLAVTGVYAVTAYYVASRVREISVRMALGATNAAVVRASLVQSTRVALVGAGAGILGAVGLAGVMRAALYDTSPLDAGVFATAVAVLILALLVATYVPVRRALRTAPASVLRSD